MKKIRTFTVFENQSLCTGHFSEGKIFSKTDLQELLNFSGDRAPFLSLKKNGVHFNDYAGIIQTENLRIEVLPRADRSFAGPEEKAVWRKIFCRMLSGSGVLSGLPEYIYSDRLESKSLLSLLFGYFLRETESILHKGLIRQYMVSEGNSGTLKGRLLFGKHILKNAVHNEKFYTQKNSYSTVNLLNCIVYKALLAVQRLNSDAELSGRTDRLLLNFPEMPDLKISRAVFEKIIFSRKNMHYRNCIRTAELILLNEYRVPKPGRFSGFAMMTELNRLWKNFVCRSIQKHRKKDISMNLNESKSFWISETSDRKKIKPDIILNRGKENCTLIETKWDSSLTAADFSRLHTASEYFRSEKTAFLLPVPVSKKGFFTEPETDSESRKQCRIIGIPADEDTERWQKKICSAVEDWTD